MTGTERCQAALPTFDPWHGLSFLSSNKRVNLNLFTGKGFRIKQSRAYVTVYTKGNASYVFRTRFSQDFEAYPMCQGEGKLLSGTDTVQSQGLQFKQGCKTCVTFLIMNSTK